MKGSSLIFFLGYCVVKVCGQIGVTGCTEATQINCQNFLPNSYCNLGTLLCECPGGYLAADNNIACEYDCGALTDPDNGAVATINSTRQGDLAVYTCVSTYRVIGTATRTCVQDSGWDGEPPTCEQACDSDTDNRGTVWNNTATDRVVNITCDEGFTGQITRECLSDGTWKLPVYNCVRAAVQNIENIVDTISTDTSPEILSTVLTDIQSTTTQTTNANEKITNGEMKILTTALKTIATVLPAQLVNDNTSLNTFFESVDNLIDSSNTDTWQSEPESTSAVQLVSAVDHIAEALSENLQPDETLDITNTNIALRAQTLSDSNIVFPDGSEDLDWLTKSKIELKPQAFNDVTDPIIATAVVFRDLGDILPGTYSENSDNAVENAVEKTINGPVLSMTIPSHLPRELQSPISITFEHYEKNLSDPSCAFLDYQSDSQGIWSNNGCRVVSSDNDVTVCECTHLTNFAVLMSPFKQFQADESSWNLRIISIVCLSFSIICLVGTIVLHLIFWKQLRNERTTVMLHLCVALVLSYIVFLLGVNRTKRTTLCTAIAVFLHYILLAVFGIMFVQGIQIAKAVIYVFQTKSNNVKILLGAAWGFPAIIVSISMTASQLDGYGNNQLCWLTSDSGLIWSFVGPAIVVTIFNTKCLCLVIRAIFRTRVMKIKPVGKKVRTSIWALCVLLPPLGVTWIVGLFYIDGNTDFIQYIFATLNGLQGFFIFLFHCVLNKQMKKAMGVQKTKVTSKKFTQEVVM